MDNGASGEEKRRLSMNDGRNYFKKWTVLKMEESIEWEAIEYESPKMAKNDVGKPSMAN
jgi:hypothetical protein